MMIIPAVAFLLLLAYVFAAPFAGACLLAWVAFWSGMFVRGLIERVPHVHEYEERQ